MWDWMDKAEGKKVGSSHSNMMKEKERQGYGKAKHKALEKAKGKPDLRKNKSEGHSFRGSEL